MYYGQHLQDKFLEEHVFHGLVDGFFVDVGAHDGIQINNTYFFEKDRRWKGILIEPLPCVYRELAQNRPHATALNLAVDDTDGTTEFIMNTGYTEMLSGISRHYEPEHRARLESELVSQGGSSEIIPVVTKRLETIFDEHHVTRVHLLSVDVEGAELQVVQSINFDKVFIDVILFEANYPTKARIIVDYLTAKGYAVRHCNGLDIFMVHKHSTFA